MSVWWWVGSDKGTMYLGGGVLYLCSLCFAFPSRQGVVLTSGCFILAVPFLVLIATDCRLAFIFRFEQLVLLQKE